MERVTATVEYRRDGEGKARRGKAAQLLFSPHRLFTYDDSDDEISCLVQIGDDLLAREGLLAFYHAGKFSDYFFKHVPKLLSRARCVIEDDESLRGDKLHGLTVVGPEELPDDVATVFLCETRTAPRIRMAGRIRDGVEVVGPDVLERLDWRAIPDRGWVPDAGSIYPIDIPEIRIEPGLDMVLMDMPSRNLSMMPNGLGYVHKALKSSGVRFQTVDCDIIIYHRYHTFRLLDTDGRVCLPCGREMPEDPWAAEDMSLWDDPEILDFFKDDIDEIVAELVRAGPKILGLSVQQCNLLFCREVARRAREALVDLLVIVGGYSCREADVGRKVFPECDYMAIGEADLTIAPMVQRLVSGERPADTPGFLSVHDSENRQYQPAPLPEDLDALGRPHYDWYDISVYRNFQHYQLTPVIASRGCHWGRCRFCGEALPWRARTPKNFVDELEYMVDRGCYQVVFSESDLNGDPDLVKDICREIIRRRLTVTLGGQLRIDRRNTSEFFRLLRQAGVVSLRFGVDGWCGNTLRLQNKGYNVELIRRNLKHCHEVGIYVEVNTVVGCPGETEEDVAESIGLMMECRRHIGRLANINPLQLLRGSIYWRFPQKYNIHFSQPREKLYAEHFAALPEDAWYSTEPYIDRDVRHERCDRILRTLREAGYDFGAGASPKVDALDGPQQAGDDAAQVGGSYVSAPAVLKDDCPISLTDRMFRYRGEFFRLPDGDEETIGPEKDRKAFWKRAIRAIGRREKWGIYARRIHYGAVARMRRSFHRRRTAAAEAPAADQPFPANDFGKFEILDLRHEVPPNMMTMIREGFHGYNIIRAQSNYYAIKFGYPFEIDKAVADGYAPGVCLRGRTVKELTGAILARSGL